MRIGCFDTETTSLIPKEGDIIELAICVGTLEKGVEYVYQSFNDPGYKLSDKTKLITGISDDDVSNQKPDLSLLQQVADSCDVIVCHNARFDRAWAQEKQMLRHERWACSLEMVDWKGWRMPCRCLRHVLMEHAYVPKSHRADNDVRDLFWLLQQGPWGRYDNRPIITPFDSTAYGEQLLVSLNKAWYLNFVTGKREGFRWCKKQRMWWKVTREDDPVEDFCERIAIDPTDPSVFNRYGID